MRIAILAAALLATGASGAYVISNDEKTPFAATYVSLFEESPDLVQSHVEWAMDGCPLMSMQFRHSTQPVKTLSARTFTRSMMLTAKDTPPEEASREMIPWIMANAEQLNSDEQARYLELIRQINKIDSMLCIMSSIQDSAKFRFDAAAAAWAIRS